MRFHFSMLAILLLLPGCATWNGTFTRSIYSGGLPTWSGAPRVGKVWFEQPVVVDEDRQLDFTPIAENYASTLLVYQAKGACRVHAFRECLTTPPEDGNAYKVSTKIVIHNYRPARGDRVGLIVTATFLLPPLLGAAWAYPVAAGNLKASAIWSLVGPDGNVLVQGEGAIDDIAPDSKNVTQADFDKDFLKFLKSASAVVQNRDGNDAAQVKTVETVATVERKHPAENTGAAATVSGKPGPVLAVFDIEDMSGTLPRNSLSQLTSYLAAKLTQTSGYRVVPRDQIRERLVVEQNKSYRDCYDQSCQIELGRALAAEKSLSVQIIHIGSRCAFNASIFDLRTETADRTASIDSGCSESDLMDSTMRLSEELKVF